MLDADQQAAVAEGLAAGRAEAWATLYDAYATEVWRYVARLVGGDPHAVADVVQETMLAAAQAARTFDPRRGALPAWLMGVAHRQSALFMRKASRRLAEAEALARRRTADAGVDGPHELARREQTEHIRQVLAEMPESYARLLVAKYVDEQPMAALSVELGAGVEAVRARLARARRLFRQAIGRPPRAASVVRKESDG
jgi:RNA polymerase sigma-70 factor (ECF subfamily)